MKLALAPKFCIPGNVCPAPNLTLSPNVLYPTNVCAPVKFAPVPNVLAAPKSVPELKSIEPKLKSKPVKPTKDWSCANSVPELNA